jgi:ankyrin repeat protein
METCCICLGVYRSPAALISGLLVCGACARKLSHHSLTLFSMEKLAKVPNKIAFMRRFNEIEPDDMELLIVDGNFILNIDEFKEFVDRCADLERADKSGNTILHYVCKYGSLDMLKYLMEYGVNINCVNGDGLQPIEVVSFQSDMMIKLLEKHGANVKKWIDHKLSTFDLWWYYMDATQYYADWCNQNS